MAWPDEAGILGIKGVSRRRRVKRKRRQQDLILAPLVQALQIVPQRIGNAIIVSATSALVGVVYYHWYMDGSFIESSTANEKTFFFDNNKQTTIQCIDTNDPDFDPIENKPKGYPRWYTLYWPASQSDDIKYYRIEQSLNGGDWERIGEVQHISGQWSYKFETDELEDLQTYQFRVIAYDIAGNAGSPITLASIVVVRIPQAPEVSASFNDVPNTITFAEV